MGYPTTTLDPNTGKYVPTQAAVGHVLGDRERNYHDDSDFYVLVWNGERVETIQYGSTRYVGPTSAKVDATEEVARAACEWAMRTAYAQAAKQVHEDHAAALDAIHEGTRAQVARGRKVPKGTVGRVTAIYPNRYEESNPRVILTDDRGASHRTYVRNLDIVEQVDIPAPTERDVTRAAWWEYRAITGAFAHRYRAIAEEVWGAVNLETA